MTDLTVVVLNGWASSSRRSESRTASLVRRVLRKEGLTATTYARRSMLGWARTRSVRRFLHNHMTPSTPLLLVGKSLGAHNLVRRVLNKCPPWWDGYRATALVTIDPCWPIRGDWRPNLNRTTLRLEPELDYVCNVYAVLPPDQQAGAMLAGPRVRNCPVTEYDHYSIVRSPEVTLALQTAIGVLCD